MRFYLLLTLLVISQWCLAQSQIAWSQPVSVADNQFGNMHPRVVTDGDGNPLIIWGKNSTKQVFFSRWTGNGFSSPVNLNPGTIPVFAASWAGPDLASHGDTVYVVFKETPEDDSGIYIVRSFDGGENFSGPERVDAIADSISRFPSVGTDANGNPLVAFMKFNPGWGNARYVLAKSEDHGSTFNADVLGSRFSGGDVCDCCPATVVSSGNTAALMYRDNLNNLRNSWAGISFDGGNSFNGGIEIDNTDWMINACPSSGPDGIIIGDSLYSVFMSAASGKTLCYRSRSTLSSLQLESIVPITGNFAGLGLQNFPRIATSGKAAAIAWMQTVNSSAQLAVQFTNNISNGFSAGYEVLAANHVTNTDITLSNTEVYVVWEDQNSGTVKFKSGTYMLSGWSDHLNNLPLVRIYPNPTKTSEFYVEFDAPNLSQLSFDLFDAQGQQRLSGSGLLIEGALKVEVGNLSAGVYFIRIKDQDRSVTRSVVID
ncbi:MAG: T9SS type A sorting domain-containing protein [Saprospiraceae bacterium]|nr:T9SS type A sorting domain-containing protein [Saprospiraceae bacterium]